MRPSCGGLFVGPPTAEGGVAILHEALALYPARVQVLAGPRASVERIFTPGSSRELARRLA